MYDRIYGVYEAIIEATSSELILFFVTMALMAIMVLPLYKNIIKDRKARRQHDSEKQKASQQHDSEKQDKYIEREREVIAVIKENSAVIASLKILFENQGSENRKSIERINDRIDTILTNIMQLKIILAERDCLKDNEKL